MNSEQAEAESRAETLAQLRANGRTVGEAYRQLQEAYAAYFGGIAEGAGGPTALKVPPKPRTLALTLRRFARRWGLYFLLLVGLSVGLEATIPDTANLAGWFIPAALVTMWFVADLTYRWRHRDG